MSEFGKVGLEIVKFMRGKYRLDEVAGMYYDVPCLKFRQGKKTIASINLYKDHYDFQIILGKTEREKFEAIKSEFPIKIQELYDSERTLHDGKWLLIRVDDLHTLEAIKKLILIKKNPNRKPFSKENAVYSDCGMRCDLCVHYTGGTITEEFRQELKERLTNLYKADFWGEDMMLCPGCKINKFEDFGGDPCDQNKCSCQKGITACVNCKEYPCEKATAGYTGLEHRNISADDVTWAILPYVPYQYE